MKTTTLAIVLAVAFGCSKKSTPKTTPVEPATTAAPAQVNKPPPNVTQDQQVSPTLAVSGDIIAACGIKIAAPQTGAPKFDYDKDELTAADRAVLDQIGTCLMTGALKGRAVDLIGRADPRGTEEYNLGLGSRRSGVVGSYLGRLGVAQVQLAVTTRGALDATGTDEASYAADRRVDIQLQPAKS